jgi:hypothetical protein
MKKTIFRDKIIIAAAICSLVIPAMAENESKTQKKAEDSGFWQNLSGIFSSSEREANGQILLEEQSRYFTIIVETDRNGRRLLLFKPNKGVQGIWDPANPNQLISPYAKYSAILLQQSRRKPERALFIGMGAGIVPRYIKRHYPEIAIDIIEIDPAIPGIAERFFGFERLPGVNIIIADGRDFINRNKKHYDMILIDAYGPAGTPFQLTTTEFYEKIKNALNDDGVMVINMANLNNPAFIASELKTVSSVFRDLSVFKCNDGSNYILAAKLEDELSDSALKRKFIRIDGPGNPGLSVEAIIASRILKEELRNITTGGEILKDNFAPVESMLAK